MDKKAIVIGGSAGSLEVLMELLPKVDISLNIPLIIVLHRKCTSDSKLIQLLASKTLLNVKEIEEKELVLPGTIYIAPPDYHVLIEQDETFSLDYSEKVNFSRPAIDVTFQSAAEVYKSNLFCLLLSGSSNDGVAGLKTCKQNGGIVAIQEPKSAAFPYMPAQAALNVKIDAVLEISAIHLFINKLKEGAK